MASPVPVVLEAPVALPLAILPPKNVRSLLATPARAALTVEESATTRVESAAMIWARRGAAERRVAREEDSSRGKRGGQREGGLRGWGGGERRQKRRGAVARDAQQALPQRGRCWALSHTHLLHDGRLDEIP